MGKKCNKKALKPSKDVLDAETRQGLEHLLKEMRTNELLECREVSSSSSKRGRSKNASHFGMPQPNLSRRVKSESASSSSPPTSGTVGWHFKERNYCLVKLKKGEHWSLGLAQGRDSDESGHGMAASSDEVIEAEVAAERLLGAEAKLFAKQNVSSEKRWMQSVLQKGTLSDKVSTYTVMLQESPVHHLHALESLVSMVSVKSRRSCALALDALKELFSKHLLRPDAKLRTFRQTASCRLPLLDRVTGNNADTKHRHLILWKFEDKLKSIYAKFLDAVDQVAKDTVDKSKARALGVFLEMLMSNPEQEQALLSRLVNKLGDPVRSVAAKAAHQLGKLLDAHPAMQGVVLCEVERLLHRTNVSPRAQYYAICFLTQLVIRGGDSISRQLANKLIAIYLFFFKAKAAKGKEKRVVDGKLVSALLTGVNRAYPFADVSDTVLGDHVDSVFEVVHAAGFNTSVQALMLIFQLVGGDGCSSRLGNRFYAALYKKLLATEDLAVSNKHALFLNLVFKAMKSDDDKERVLAFARRLVQICHHLPAHLVCSVEFLLSELFRAKQEVKEAFGQILNARDDGEETMSGTEGDDDDEKFFDFDDEGNALKVGKSSSALGWVFRRQEKRGEGGRHYDPERRNPVYAGAGKEPCWEVSSLVDYFHPSAQLFTENLLRSTATVYAGDPLQDFTLARFLDRFVFRNPKKEPGKGRLKTVFASRNVYRPEGAKKLAIDSKEYLGKDEALIPADEKFIYKYLKEKRELRPDEQVSDAESVASEEFDEAIEEAMMSTGNVDLNGEIADLDGDEDDDQSSDDGDYFGGDVELAEDFGKVEDFDNLSDDDDTAGPVRKKRKVSSSRFDALAPAEEFAEILEQSAAAGEALGGFNDVSNFDRSTAKQLKWEKGRHSELASPSGRGRTKAFKKRSIGKKAMAEKKRMKKSGGGRKKNAVMRR